jgi:tripartite-type tricarboxylate transporter receptor subunit TctC
LFAGGSPLGTALVAPPGVPKDVAAALRRAFDAAMRDPALLADVKKSRVDIDPLPGEELQKVVAGTFDIRSDVLARAQQLSRQVSAASRP